MCDALNGVSWHGELCPAVADNACAGGEAHEKMAALGIARGTEADGAKRAMAQIVGVFFVSLHISAKRETDVFVVRKVAAGEEEPRRMFGGNSIFVGQGVEPEYGIANQTNNNQPREGAERE